MQKTGLWGYGSVTEGRSDAGDELTSVNGGDEALKFDSVQIFGAGGT